ncbi:MAG: glycosyltransferase [Candidatus Korobacteraceae bacterium]
MKQIRVAVCMATRNRQAGLTRALAGLAKQDLGGCDIAVQMRVIVIDNDGAGPAAAACDALRPGYPCPLVYAIEPEPGIVFARNRALELAKDADFIAFIDDDEVPAENWLAELLSVQRLYGADVVFGAVLKFFPEPVPKWVSEGSLFPVPRKKTGTVCPYGATGNVLFSTRILKEAGFRFNERFALSGGEDYEFFQRANQAGYLMVWADEAVVTEWIPRSRAKAAWLFKRHFRYGSTTISLTTFHSAAGRALAAMIALGRVLVGITCALMFVPLGRRYSVKGLVWAGYGLGLLFGLSGRHFSEYRTIHTV